MIQIIKKDGTVKSGNPSPGNAGADGLSAYEIWLQEGNSGSEGDFLSSLVGPTGPAGSSYTHTQSLPTNVWIITHNLGFYPNVSVFDSAGSQVLGEIDHLTNNALTITYAAGFSGVAYLS